MIHLSQAEYAAIRAQIAALAALVDALADGQPADESRACPHDEVLNEGTFGAPVFRCAQCRQVVPGEVVAIDES